MAISLAIVSWHHRQLADKISQGRVEDQVRGLAD